MAGAREHVSGAGARDSFLKKAFEVSQPGGRRQWRTHTCKGPGVGGSHLT
jgi:hypothetical protein